jgi:hypothetical protein
VYSQKLLLSNYKFYNHCAKMCDVALKFRLSETEARSAACVGALLLRGAAPHRLQPGLQLSRWRLGLIRRQARERSPPRHAAAPAPRPPSVASGAAAAADR